MAALAAAWPALVAAGTAVGAYGQIQQGRAEAKAAGAEASQMEQRALSVRAASQRKAMEETRQGRLAESRAQALAAKSGSGGPTVVDIVSDLAKEGAYRHAVALYEGESGARGLEYGAGIRRYQGKLARRAGYMGALSTALMGAGSIGSRMYTPPPPAPQQQTFPWVFGMEMP
jgi:hypothetical protein